MKLYEKLFGLDNMYTIQTMKDCCSYYFELEKYDKAIQMQLKALYLYDLIGGDLNPNSLLSLDELSILYHEKKDLKESILCIEEKLRRLKLLYKKNPENYISVLGRLAFLYNEAKDNASAISYTVQRLELIQKCIVGNSKVSGDIDKFLKYFKSGDSMKNEKEVEENIKLALNIVNRFPEQESIKQEMMQNNYLKTLQRTFGKKMNF